MAVKRKYRLNLRNYGNLPAIMLSQYDEGYALDFEIRDGTDAASDLSAYTVTLKGTRADTLAYSFSGTIATNVLTFVIDTTMTACAGRGTAEIAIKDTANDVLFATFNMPVFVERAAVPEGSIDADVERAQEIAEEVEELIDGATEGAEAWAVGQRGGVDVESTDETYHNNAKYYAEQAAESAASIGIDATLTQAGKAADAKKTGDEISDLNEDLSHDLNNGDLVVETRGNIFSGCTIAGRIDNTTGADTTGNYVRSDYVPLDTTKSTLYCIRTATTWNTRLFFYNASKTFISSIVVWSSGNTATTATVTIPTNSAYVRSYKADTDTTELCLSYTNLGSYVAYIGNTCYIKNGVIKEEQLSETLKDKVITKYAVLSNVSLDGVVEDGRYQISSNVTEKPANVPAYLQVVVSAENKEWLQQYFVQTINGTGIWFRNGRNQSGVYTNFGTSLSVSWGAWSRVSASTNSGQTVVCLGDSIFGQNRGNTSIPSLLSIMSGATVYNCALGGTRAGGRSGASETITKWKNFDFVKLSESIVAGDYTAQTGALDATGVPSYFSTVFNTLLPSIDFSEVDIIIINYGGNDYTGGNEIGSLSGTIDANTYLGGLYTGITNLLGEFPNLRFLLVSPPYKCFLENGEWASDSDDTTYNTQNNTLGDFAESLTALQAKIHSPLCDLYNSLGINKYNYPIWFIEGDGSHPNDDGRMMTAKLVYRYLMGM